MEIKQHEHMDGTTRLDISARVERKGLSEGDGAIMTVSDGCKKKSSSFLAPPKITLFIY
jgi:hypothetical protein